MLIYDVLHKEKVYQIVTNDLRTIGVKYRFKKNALKIERSEKVKGTGRKVFKTPLSYQPLDVVNLSSGGIVHVPVFVSQATVFLENHVTQEGLFRKAGSQIRQKELIARLDSGGTIGEKHHAIDVANCLKSFFRDLPEPLIPYVYHDLFVHCVMLKSHRVQALLLACILLPPHHLNTLAFFMEFLRKVSLYEKQNKMSIDNLAKVIGPNIMPLQETTMSAVQSRLEMHLIIVKILIENAENIGILPDHITQIISAEVVGSTDNELDISESQLHGKSKKKKHRSGSLTRKPHLSASNLNLSMSADLSTNLFHISNGMFNGLKKIVGKGAVSDDGDIMDNQFPINFESLQTSSVKFNKKRKINERPDPPSMKKKRTANKTDKSKKLRLSLDRFVPRNKHKNIEGDLDSCVNTFESCAERRWSSVSNSPASQKKQRTYSDGPSQLKLILKNNEMLNNEFHRDYNDVFIDADVNLSDDSSEQVLLMKEDNNIKQWLTKTNISTEELNVSIECSANTEVASIEKAGQNKEYVRIPRSEYEEIKNRVSAIESHISHEFGYINNERSDNLAAHSSVNKVQTEYEKTLEEASIESIVTADYLAKRLSKELKIRKPGEHKIIRSPSARKIGNLRRRSQEKVIGKRIRRTASWHISQESDQECQLHSDQQLNNIYAFDKESNLHSREESKIKLDFLQKHFDNFISETVKNERGSLNDIHGYNTTETIGNRIKSSIRRASSFHGNEFTNNSLHFNRKGDEFKKTNSQQNFPNTDYLTRQTSMSDNWRETVVSWKDADNYFKSKSQVNTPAPRTGRASIAKLRAQNAGMVLAKAKLFDEQTLKMSSCGQENLLNRKYYYDKQLQASKHKESESSEIMDRPCKRTVASRRQLSKSPKNRTPKSMQCANSPSYNKTEEENITFEAYQHEKSSHRRLSQKLNIQDQKLVNKDIRINEISAKSKDCHKENINVKTSPLMKKVPVNTLLHDTSINIYKSDINSLCKTPHIKRPLTVKTPKSSKSLVRKAPVDSRRTPLKAVAQLGTPKHQSPKSILKSRNLSRHVY